MDVKMKNSILMLSIHMGNQYVLGQLSQGKAANIQEVLVLYTMNYDSQNLVLDFELSS